MVPAEFTPPGPKDFNLPPIFSDVAWFNKTILVAIVAAIIIIAYFVIATARLRTVPTKGQFAAEYIYNFARNTIARDMIGHDFIKYVPYIAALFFFILVNNLAGSLVFVQFPTFSHIGWAYAAAILSWAIYNGAGIWVHGAKHDEKPNPVVRVLKGIPRYLKHQTVPPGAPGWLLPLLTPIELISNILVRPISLSLRLFANMFAGHILILVFVLGGEYLVRHTGSIPLAGAGVGAWVFGLALGLFEIFVQAMQAFIFALLTAQYIGSAISDTH